MVFDERLQARAAKGRVFGATGVDPYEPLATVSGATWDPTNVYEVGEMVYGTSATYSGGTEEALFRSRIQRRDSADDAWENTPWESHSNVATVIGGVLTHAGQVRLQTQAKDDDGTRFRDVDEYATDQVNSFASVKTVTYPDLVMVDQPVITGTPYIGNTITCSAPRVEGGQEPYSYNYQWLDVRNSSNTTTLVEFDKDKFVSCYVTVTSADGQTVNATSNSIGPVIYEPPNLRIITPLQGEFDLRVGNRETLEVSADGTQTRSYLWQYQDQDDNWQTATKANMETDYPDADALIFEVNRDNEPRLSTFMITMFTGPGPTSMRCIVRDTDPDGEFDQSIQTTTLNYV